MKLRSFRKFRFWTNDRRVEGLYKVEFMAGRKVMFVRAANALDDTWYRLPPSKIAWENLTLAVRTADEIRTIGGEGDGKVEALGPGVRVIRFQNCRAEEYIPFLSLDAESNDLPVEALICAYDGFTMEDVLEVTLNPMRPADPSKPAPEGSIYGAMNLREMRDDVAKARPSVSGAGSEGA